MMEQWTQQTESGTHIMMEQWTQQTESGTLRTLPPPLRWCTWVVTSADITPRDNPDLCSRLPVTHNDLVTDVTCYSNCHSNRNSKTAPRDNPDLCSRLPVTHNDLVTDVTATVIVTEIVRQHHETTQTHATGCL